MQINKLSQFNFGMPKITDKAKTFLPTNLSEADKKKLEDIEKIHPNANLGVYPDYSDSGENNNVILRAARVLDRISGKNPNYYITVNELSSTPDNKSIVVQSDNGKISCAKAEEGKKGVIYVQSSTKKYGEVTPDDLVEATNIFVERYNKAEAFAKKVRPKK